VSSSCLLLPSGSLTLRSFSTRLIIGSARFTQSHRPSYFRIRNRSTFGSGFLRTPALMLRHLPPERGCVDSKRGPFLLSRESKRWQWRIAG
jgi:hypothetical protein